MLPKKKFKKNKRYLLINSNPTLPETNQIDHLRTKHSRNHKNDAIFSSFWVIPWNFSQFSKCSKRHKNWKMVQKPFQWSYEILIWIRAEVNSINELVGIWNAFWNSGRIYNVNLPNSISNNNVWEIIVSSCFT